LVGLFSEGNERASRIPAGRLGRRATGIGIRNAERAGLWAVISNLLSPIAEPFGPSLIPAHPIAAPTFPISVEKIGIVLAFRSKGCSGSQGKDGGIEQEFHNSSGFNDSVDLVRKRIQDYGKRNT